MTDTKLWTRRKNQAIAVRQVELAQMSAGVRSVIAGRQEEDLRGDKP